MALHILHSNRAEVLLEDLARQIREPVRGAGLLAGETILIDNPSLGSWINLQLALKNSVAANIRYVQPAALFWELSRALVSGAIPEQTPLSKEEMSWRLLGLLQQQDVLEHAALGPVRNYLAVDHKTARYTELKRFQLASSVADLFDQYLVYRPHWFGKYWDRGKKINDSRVQAHPQSWQDAEAWQRVLWCELLGQVNTPKELSHRAAIEMQLFQALSAEVDVAGLKFRRLFVFGITSMPETQLDTLMLLAKHVDIYLYLLNPCAFEWFGIRSAREIARLAAWQTMQSRSTGQGIDMMQPENNSAHPDFQYLEIGNPLLAGQADQIKEFIRMIFQKFDSFQEHAEIRDDLHFVDPGNATLLGSIQGEILQLNYRGEVARLSVESGQAKAMPEAEQKPENVPSIHIHNCHSPLREVEVLHDQLLDMFNRDKSLKPRDVVVMMPRVAPYVPYVHSVFRGGADGPQIDYHINDRSLQEESPLLNSFETLLKLPDSRLPLSEVLGVFEVPAVHRRFGLDREGFELLKAWLIRSGVRWGLDAAHRKELGLPAYSDFSWAFGMSRLLAGYAMRAGTDGAGVDFAGMDFASMDFDEQGDLSGLLEMKPAVAEAAAFHILPLDEVEGSNAAILDSFIRFWRVLNRYRTELDAPRRPDQWKTTLGDILDAFYEPEDDEGRALNALRCGIEDLDTASAQGWYDGLLPREIIRALIKPVLQQVGDRRHPWSEGVKFCSLLPMRGVPFRVVYLMGMNMDDYPRRLDRSSFDLMRKDYRPGDRSARVDDRWLFLEALLSARQVFHVSYLGQDMHRNEKREPSVVLSELIDYIRKGYESDGLFQKSELRENTWLYSKHPLQPFNPQYFQGATGGGCAGRLFSFRQQAFKLAAGQLQARSGQGSALSGNERWQPYGLPDPGLFEVELEDFIRFFTRPWDWFFTHHGVALGRYEDEVEDEDVFGLQQGLGPWKLVDELLKKTGRSDFVVPDEPQERERLKKRLISALVATRKASGDWPIGRAAVKEEEKLTKLDTDYLFMLSGQRRSRVDIRLDIPLESTSPGNQPHLLRIVGSIDRYQDEFLARSASNAGLKHLLDYYIRLAVACNEPVFRDCVVGARMIFKNTRDVDAPENFEPGGVDLPLQLGQGVLANEVGSLALLKQLAGLYLAHREQGLPFHSELSPENFESGADEWAEIIEQKWFGSGSTYHTDTVIRDDMKQRAYYGSPEALDCDVFRATSRDIWKGIRRCLQQESVSDE